MVVKAFDTLVAVVAVTGVIDLDLALGAQLRRVNFRVLHQLKEIVRRAALHVARVCERSQEVKHHRD